MFKGNFLLWVVVEFAWFAIQLTLIQVIYSHVQDVAGWNKYQMIVLIGTNDIVQKTFQLIFMINCMELPENIRTGKLDFALLQPANSQFLVSIRKFDIGSIINGSSAFAITYYALWKLDVHVTFQQVILYVVLILNGVLIHYALMLAIVTISFWIVRAQGLVYGYYNLFQIARMPREAFKGISRIFFTFCIPMLVVANFPASVLAHGMTDWRNLWVFGIAAFFLLTVTFWFRYALRFYTSASS